MEYDKKTKYSMGQTPDNSRWHQIASGLGNQQIRNMLPQAADGTRPIQRQIQIGAYVYTTYEEINTQRFKQVFGGDPRYLEGLSDTVVNNLDAFLFDGAVHQFNSFVALLNACLPRAGGVLNIAVPGVIHGAPPMAPIGITMTGTRGGDVNASNAAMGFAATPAGFTWHHIEGIIPNGVGGFTCNMVLVQTLYHQNHHNGGVREYEMATGIAYG